MYQFLKMHIIFLLKKSKQSNLIKIKINIFKIFHLM